MKRNKILALIGAGVLSMGVVGVALATELNTGQEGITLGEKAGTEQQCAGVELNEGEVLLHFVLTGTSDTDGTLDVDLSNPDTSAHADHVSKDAGGTLHWEVIVTGVDAETVLDGAETNATGNNLNLSHVCGLGTTTTTTTEDTSSTTTEETTTTTTTEFTSSEQSTTDTVTTTTNFTDSVSETTDVTQPPTDTIGSTGSGQQSSGLWMLLAALGVLAGSVIILAPSKAKSKD